jgi:hypothetical protein
MSDTHVTHRHIIFYREICDYQNESRFAYDVCVAMETEN